MTDRRVGVVLFQLGGPDSLEAVEPFLYNLFRDPDIIDFPLARIARDPLARLIAASRARKVRHHYAEIGGRSPIREVTERQARALEAVLGPGARVVVAMRYWHPLTEEAIRQLEAAQVDEVVLLPLYPQYSSTTTGSSLNEWRRQTAAAGFNHVPVRVVREFHEHAGYLEALVSQVNRTLARFPSPAGVELVFSAHNVPVATVHAGDPYQRQIQATVDRVCERGAWTLARHVCYQSKVGGARWLEPGLDQTIRQLAARGARKLLVIPIAFVSDHVETLSEIDREARELASRCGVEQFEMMPGLNDSPRFIAALAEMVEQARGKSSRR